MIRKAIEESEAMQNQ
jgi:hypothetical protein